MTPYAPAPTPREVVHRNRSAPPHADRSAAAAHFRIPGSSTGGAAVCGVSLNPLQPPKASKPACTRGSLSVCGDAMRLDQIRCRPHRDQRLNQHDASQKSEHRVSSLVPQNTVCPPCRHQIDFGSVGPSSVPFDRYTSTPHTAQRPVFPPARRYSTGRCATTPAWSEGHCPVARRSSGLSPTVAVRIDADSLSFTPFTKIWSIRMYSSLISFLRFAA